MRIIGMILVILAVLLLPAACAAYKYKDCKKVGHSTFYCVLDMGK